MVRTWQKNPSTPLWLFRKLWQQKTYQRSIRCLCTKGFYFWFSGTSWQSKLQNNNHKYFLPWNLPQDPTLHSSCKITRRKKVLNLWFSVFSTFREFFWLHSKYLFLQDANYAFPFRHWVFSRFLPSQRMSKTKKAWKTLWRFQCWTAKCLFRCQIGEEALACRNNAALFDLSYSGKFYLCGAEAQDTADYLFAANTRCEVNQTISTCVLNKRGGVEADCTVTRIEPGSGGVTDPIFQRKAFYIGEQMNFSL